jgi:HemY protein
MIKVIAFLAAVLAAAMGLSWLADNNGTVTVEWPALNFKAEPSVFQVVVGLALLIGTALVVWSMIRQLVNSPAALGNLMNKRRQERGLDALSSGMIAIGAGDRDTATRYAIQARKSLPNEPLTHLLRAQAAQLSGDKATSRRIFEAMLSSPDTEQLGLRGLFLEAQRENEPEAARQFAERAVKLNAKLGWATDALFDIQCKAGDWDGALDTLATARRNGQLDKTLADRRRAVLLTGLALTAEEGNPNQAIQYATEAHGLAPDLVPAANLAGRMYAARGNTAKAAKIIQKTWSRCPHPDLATAYAFARIGDSPRDRLTRITQLAALNPHSVESALAVANAAIDAKDYEEARRALAPMLEERLSQRVATLMARLESEQHGDKGRVREWLARAINAERDPVWTADGVVSETWAPISPVTGQLDAFQWKVPVETVGGSNTELMARRAEELVALGAPLEVSAKPADQVPANAASPTPSPMPPMRSKAATDVVAEPVTARPAPQANPAAAPTTNATPVAPAKPAETKMADQTAAQAVASAAPKPVSAEPVKPVTAKPATTTSPAKNGTTSKTIGAAPGGTAGGTGVGKEPKIYVVPHAPDDPGPDAADGDPTGKAARPTYRTRP